MNAYPKHSYIDVNIIAYYVNLAIKGVFSLLIAWKSANKGASDQAKQFSNKVIDNND